MKALEFYQANYMLANLITGMPLEFNITIMLMVYSAFKLMEIKSKVLLEKNPNSSITEGLCNKIITV